MSNDSFGIDEEDYTALPRIDENNVAFYGDVRDIRRKVFK